jgi:hypothetical protein
MIPIRNSLLRGKTERGSKPPPLLYPRAKQVTPKGPKTAYILPQIPQYVKMFGKSPPSNQNFVCPTIDRTAFFGYNK